MADNSDKHAKALEKLRNGHQKKLDRVRGHVQKAQTLSDQINAVLSDPALASKPEKAVKKVIGLNSKVQQIYTKAIDAAS